jgi:PAS domain S-box-containing protein
MPTMKPTENLQKIKNEYEAALRDYGNAMVLIDSFNNIVYTNNSFAQAFGVGQGELKGTVWTTVTKAFEYKEGEEVSPEARPSEAAVFSNEITVDTFYINLRDNPELFLVTLTAIPLLLDAEIAGGILVLKILKGK